MATTILQQVGTPKEASDQADPECRKAHLHVLGIWFSLGLEEQLGASWRSHLLPTPVLDPVETTSSKESRM